MWLAVNVRWRYLVLAATGAILVGHSLVYNFVTDDAYISFVFSRNFAEHGELAFNLGAPVEGYTNFSWTVLLGLLMKLGLEPEFTSRLLGTACALGTLWFSFRAVDRALGGRSPWAVVPPLLLATSSGFACWTSGGLETQLFTVLVAAALDALVATVERPRALGRVAICLAFASMTRPEGPMVAAIFGAIHLWSWVAGWVATRKRPGFGEELRAAAWFLALWAPWFAWRWWYYGYPFPNTYYVKASGPWANPTFASQMFDNGLYYVWSWAVQTRVLYALPIILVGLVAPSRASLPARRLARSALALGVIYLAYAVTVGGDFMGLHRFIMPVFVVAAIGVALGLARLAGFVPDAARRIAAPLAVALVVGGFAYTQVGLTRASVRFGNFANDHGIDTPAFLITYTEDRAAIGRAMAPCFRDDDFSIVGGAGAQPYYGHMRGIDVFGLVSEKIAHDEPRIRPRAGHTKFGSEKLLATYDPTFVFSCYAIHKQPAQPPLGCAGYWLGRGYEEVTVHVPGMREQGEYYTVLAKKSRAFQCSIRVH
ncbi:MAG: hypothetical protein NT062_04760 [Proteobacteria bacterium]|nr:hypothetical protein [Pseudomonadota bacterium]